ncbi:MAG: DPP IV N-terminal domain-containing protein [Acidobacteriota bacterium]
MKRTAAVLALALALADAAALPVSAGGPPPLTLKEALQPAAFGGQVPRSPCWAGGLLLFFEPAPGGEPGDLVALDPRTGARRTVLSREAFQKADGARGPLSSLLPSPDGSRVLLKGMGTWILDLGRGALEPFLPPETEVGDWAWSPDGGRVAFANDRGLFVAAPGAPPRLLVAGEPSVIVGRPDWLYGEELDLTQGFLWAPDSRHLAVWRFDEGGVPTYPMVDVTAGEPKAEMQFYPRPGDPNPQVSLLWVDAGTGEARPVPGARSGEGYLPRAAFTPDGRRLVFSLLDRLQQRLELRYWEVQSGATGLLLEEHSETWLNFLGPPRFLKDGRFLWVSERQGTAGLEVVSPDGSRRPLTSPPFLADDLLAVDPQERWAFLAGTDGDPLRKFLFRVDLRKGALQKLTPAEGWHEAAVSPGGAFALDLFSRLGVPPKAALLDLRRGRSLLLYDNPSPEVVTRGLGRAEVVTLRASDGTLLYGKLQKPVGFDPSRRYPVVVQVYGGPHAQMVQDRFVPRWDLIDRLFLEKGFAVFCLDNRGSARRGTAFEGALFRRLGRVELEDQLAGVAYLKSLPWVDGERIGLWGWSYGGFMTLYALTHAPAGTFRAGAAVAPVSDWRLYDSCYTERYLGLPGANAEGYRESSPVFAADELEGRLLLAHGLSDDNVHFGNSATMADALLKAQKPFEMAYYPRQNHGIRELSHREDLFRRILQFFEEALASPRPQ